MFAHFLLTLITLSLKGAFSFFALRAFEVTSERDAGNYWLTRVEIRPIVRSFLATFKSAIRAE